MDISTTPPYEEMQRIYNQYFSLKYMGKDINSKFALISLTCYITNKMKEKNPDISHWTVLYKLNQSAGGPVSEDFLKGLAVICSDFAYGCTEFPTFGIEDKKIPEKIKELLSNQLPF